MVACLPPLTGWGNRGAIQGWVGHVPTFILFSRSVLKRGLDCSVLVRSFPIIPSTFRSVVFLVLLVEKRSVPFHSVLYVLSGERFHSRSIPFFVENGSILVPFFILKYYHR